MLIAAFAEAKDPVGEARVQTSAPSLAQASVGDLARERMLEDVLDFPLERGSGPPADEVPAFEHSQIRIGSFNQLVDRTGPEHAPDHGRGLKRCLLRVVQEVDPRSEDGLHRIRDLEARGHVIRAPASVSALEHARIDETAEHLLDEERIALGALDDQLADRGRQVELE